MEFPEDVLDIIKQYAKPRMQFIAEFNDAKRVFTEAWDKSMLADVKVKLYTSDAEQIITALTAYKNSQVEYRRVLHICLNDRFGINTVEPNINLINESNASSDIYLRCHYALTRVLYGEHYGETDDEYE